jgi:tetratricopeptide (TPR) repeat protein
MKKLWIFFLAALNGYEALAQQTAADYYKSACAKVITSGNYKGAIKDFTKAIELNPQYDSAYSRRGYCKHFLKQYKEAITDYTKAIEISPGYGDAYYNRALSEYKLQDYNSSIADNTKAIELDPKNASAYQNRGVCRNDALKDYQGAISDYTKAIEIDPNSADSYSNRGNSKFFLADKKGACEDWKKGAAFGNKRAAQNLAKECK